MTVVRATSSAALALLVATLLAACSGEDDALAEARRLTPPASTAPAPGTERVTCEVESDEGLVLLVLDIPQDYEPDDRRCAWRGPRPAKGSGPTEDTLLEIMALDDSDYPPVRDTYADDLELVGTGGDDDVGGLDLRVDVPVFGETLGTRYTYGCACDGLGAAIRYAEFAGVQLRWVSSFDAEDQTDAAFEAALDSGGVVEDVG